MNTEINHYHFTETKTEGITDVMLNLTEYTDESWRNDVLPYFEIDVMRGTRTVSEGRVVYQFQMSNSMAYMMKTAIINAMIILQGQQN